MVNLNESYINSIVPNKTAQADLEVSRELSQAKLMEADTVINILKDEEDTTESVEELVKDKREEIRETAEDALKNKSEDGVISVVIRLFKRGY